MTPNYERAARLAREMLMKSGAEILPVVYARLGFPLKIMGINEFSKGTAPDVIREKFTDGVSAKIKTGEFLILFDEKSSEGRKRFTIFHEIGHIALGHDVTGSLQEAEADAFAGEMLFPLPVLSFVLERLPGRARAFVPLAFGGSGEAYDMALKRPDYAGEYLAAELAGRFGAEMAEKITNTAAVFSG